MSASRVERGTSSIAATVGLATATLLVSGTVDALAVSARLLTEIRRSAAGLDLARSITEARRAAPCSGQPACPQGYRCQSELAAHDARAGLFEIRTVVEREDGHHRSSVSVLVANPQACS